MTNSIRKWREKQGLTQDEAARRLGITPRNYQAYEGGEYLPPRTVRKLMRAIDMGVELEPWPISKTDEERRTPKAARKGRAH